VFIVSIQFLANELVAHNLTGVHVELIEASFNHFDRAGTDIERNAAVTATERL